MKKLGLTLLTGIISTLGFTQNVSLEWAKHMGGSSYDYGFCIKTDASGNIYTIGNFRDTVDFDPGTGVFNLISNGNMDIFIQKLSPNGNFVWAKQIGGTGLDDGKSIVIDPSGYLYTTGIFNGTVDIDPGSSTVNFTTQGNHDIFVQKLDTAGNFVWAKQMGGPFVDFGNSITLDASGNVYTTGYFRDTVDFDPGSGVANLYSTGNSNNNIFIQKLAANGNFVWAKQTVGTSIAGSSYITTDASNNIYLTGYFRDTVDFDPGVGVTSLITNGFNDIFIQKLDSNGNLVWVKHMGGTLVDYGYSLATDLSGNVYSTGYFRDTVDFDPSSGVSNLIANTNTDVYIQKLASNGSFEWAKQIGSSSSESGTSIGTDSTGNVYVTGYFQSTVDFDPGAGTYNLTSNGSSDIFIQKLATNGNFIWAKQFGGTANDFGRSITTDNRGNIYLTGSFEDTVDFDPGMDTLNFISKGNNDYFVQKLNQCYSSVYGTDTLSECSPFVWIDGNTYTTDNTTAKDTLIGGAADGCDSIITLHLTILIVDTSVSQTGTQLTSNELGANYHWLDCNSNLDTIAGATSQTYQPLANGSYAVAVTSNGCTDTSSCYVVANVGLVENSYEEAISISPNPATNKVSIVSKNIKVEKLSIMDSRGRLVRTVTNKKDIDIADLSRGVYFLQIQTNKGLINKKFIKE